LRGIASSISTDTSASHHFAGDDRHRLADEVALLAGEHVRNDIRNSHPSVFGHRVLLSSIRG